MALIRRTLPGGDSYGYETGSRDLFYFNAAGDLVNTAPYGSGVFYDYAFSRVKPVLGTVIKASSKPSIPLLKYAPRLSFSRSGQPADFVAPRSAADAVLGEIEF